MSPPANEGIVAGPDAPHRSSRAGLISCAAVVLFLVCANAYATYYFGDSALSGTPSAGRMIWVAAGASTLALIGTLTLAVQFRRLAHELTLNEKSRQVLSAQSSADQKAMRVLEERMAQGNRELSAQAEALLRSEDRGERLQVFSDTLEAFVKARTIELESRTAQLEAANRDLEAFSYSVSHDLRAPLRAINGFAEILVARHVGGLDAQGQHFLANIVEASVNMGLLIDDLLRYCRLGRSAVHLRDVDTQAVMDQVLATFAARISASGGRVEVSRDLPTVRGDATLLGQIFGNYLDNALTYGRQSIPPRVSVSATWANARWTFAFSDEGIGIAPHQIEKIFEPFQRLHSVEQYPGTGIGLALVRKAAEMLDGRAWAESGPGTGSTFYFCLPAVSALAPPPASHPFPSPLAEPGNA